MSQQKSPKKNNFKNAAMLSGIAFEMGIIIFLAVKGGKWLDVHYQNEKNIFTVIATLLGVAISIWVVLQQLKRIKY
ncbi:AtpZ/AtpI family protein [Flagellimonas hymeniacidonis]|uniref:AtpZ/AtpI family protein n=1 Tax=Flagellimonas hymeniacidonis TaxID=2603628 RepID=A0A5C8V8V3_9FLAO|nr:AtpZ/AtpI family protein [Flagellimonas hymeniacidonis]TXN37589.1 AtpZ/AtpI family protein [Flagellimonas hymeniacidonis]